MINQLQKNKQNKFENESQNTKHYFKKRSTVSYVNNTYDKCLEYASCDVSKSKAKWFCHCDDNCVDFGDCCYDYKPSPSEEKVEGQSSYTCNN